MPAPRPRRALKSIAAVVALAALSAGAWALERWKPFADDSVEVTWPDNITELAEFVEHSTGLSFLHDVEVEFIADTTEYDARINAAYPPAPSEPDGAARDAAGRALGLWDGDFSRVDGEAVFDTFITDATWIRDENTLVVHARDNDNSIDPVVKTEIIVELVVALNDQHFHFAERALATDSRQQYNAYLALDIGHALWVQSLYIEDGLSSSEYDTYVERQFEDDMEAVDALDTVVPAYRALRSAAVRLGPTFVELLSTSPEALYAAMADDSPEALDQVALPVRKYQRRDALEAVEAARAPEGAEQIYVDQGGPVMLHMMMATGMPAHEALTASDGWGNDSYVAYRLDGRVCVDLHVVADSRADAELLEAGLLAWATARPAEADAMVGRDGVRLFVSSCDPGPDIEQYTPTADDVEQFFGRAWLIRLGGGRRAERSECVGATVYANFDEVEMNDGTVDFFTEVENAEADCAAAD